jgi:acetyltransferase-like isoleucine patch superfamily enzyme
MKPVEFALADAELHALEALGLKLFGLRNTRRLAAGSRIEGPTSIVAATATGAFIDVGAFCNLSGGTINNARIGRYCSIASGVVIGPHEHPTDWLTTSRTAYYPQVNGWDRLITGEAAQALHARKRPFPQGCPVTTLGPDVWIGQGAFVKAGVTIGPGAIIGARATVVRDVPPYAIIVGTPGRILRLRFPEATVARLLALAWWQYSIYDLFDAPFDDIDRALAMIEAMVAESKVAPYAGTEIHAPDLCDPRALIARLSATALPTP